VLMLVMVIMYIVLLATTPVGWLNIVIAVVSMLCLIVMAIVGFVGIFKPSKGCLLWFGIVMIILAIFALITIILFFLNVGGFTAQASNSTGLQTGLFLAITIIVIVIAVIGAIAALLLRWSFKREEKYSEHTNYYE